MALRKRNVINISDINHIHDVLKILKQLENTLTKLNLEQFELFNSAYLIVTTNIKSAMKDGVFEQPEFISKFLVNFASYYFNAVNDCYDNSSKLSKPWGKLDDYKKLKSSPIFISLLMGANAHINHDLPLVLEKLTRLENTEKLIHDIIKIDKILMKSGKEIIGLFEEKSKFLNFLKKHFQFLYYRPAMYTILYWRIKAWRNYRKLKNHQITKREISIKTARISDRLIFIARVLG